MNYLVLAVWAVIFLVILWIPAWTVAFWLRGLRVPRPFFALRLVCPAQLLIAVGLIFLCAFMGLHNPAGYVLAITVGTGVAGAAALWWWWRPLI